MISEVPYKAYHSSVPQPHVKTHLIPSHVFPNSLLVLVRAGAIYSNYKPTA